MEEVLRSLLAFLWVGAIIALTWIERTTPWEDPIDRVVYRIIWWYILLVFIWPSGAKKTLTQVVEKFDLWNFSIWFKNNDKS